MQVCYPFINARHYKLPFSPSDVVSDIVHSFPLVPSIITCVVDGSMTIGIIPLMYCRVAKK